MTINLFDVVELVIDTPTMPQGSQGTIVFSHADDWYEVEFESDDNDLNLLTLHAYQFIVVWQAETAKWVSPEQQQLMRQIRTLYQKTKTIVDQTATHPLNPPRRNALTVQLSEVEHLTQTISQSLQ